jgi:hypothetical protein
LRSTRVPDDAVEQRPVDVPFDQVVLRARTDRGGAEQFVGEPGQHDNGRVRDLTLQPPDAVKPGCIREPKVEQHAGGAEQQWFRGGQRAGLLQPHRGRVRRGGHVVQQFLHDQRVAVVILDQENVDPGRHPRGGNGGAWQILGHHSGLVRGFARGSVLG